MKLKKLDMRGFSHDIALVVFVVIFAISGVAYLVASRADSCTPVSGAVSTVSGSVSTPVCQPASGPVSSPTGLAPGEQLSKPPQRRPVQYVHVCVNSGTTYVSQGTPNCLPGDIFQFNYAPSVSGTVYNVPCMTTGSSLIRYVYISQGESCPSGTTLVVTTTGEQLSKPPQRRPVQYVHVCNGLRITYITQGTPNCLPGGTFQFNYAPSVPGTYYNIPCATTSTSPTSLRYAYISRGESCPVGTVPVK